MARLSAGTHEFTTRHRSSKPPTCKHKSATVTLLLPVLVLQLGLGTALQLAGPYQVQGLLVNQLLQASTQRHQLQNHEQHTTTTPGNTQHAAQSLADDNSWHDRQTAVTQQGSNVAAAAATEQLLAVWRRKLQGDEQQQQPVANDSQKDMQSSRHGSRKVDAGSHHHVNVASQQAASQQRQPSRGARQPDKAAQVKVAGDAATASSGKSTAGQERVVEVESLADIEKTTGSLEPEHWSLLSFELIMLGVLATALPVVYWRKLRTRHL